jgi:hypothetical protein
MDMFGKQLLQQYAQEIGVRNVRLLNPLRKEKQTLTKYLI